MKAVRPSENPEGEGTAMELGEGTKETVDRER